MERRTFLLSSLMAAVAVKLAKASPIDPNQTFILQREDIKFMPATGLPSASGEMAKLYGDLNEPGPYLVLMRWNPGWFSAPHSYATDRIQVVVSGTWWVDSGADFTPKMAVSSENLIRWIRSRKENRIMIETDGDLLQTSARIYVGLLSFA